MHASANTLDATERQKRVRLLVQEILINDDEITIRHSIPIMNRPLGTSPTPTAEQPRNNGEQSYRLRSGRNGYALSTGTLFRCPTGWNKEARSRPSPYTSVDEGGACRRRQDATSHGLCGAFTLFTSVSSHHPPSRQASLRQTQSSYVQC